MSNRVNKMRLLITVGLLGASLLISDQTWAGTAPVVPLPVKTDFDAILSLADEDQTKKMLDAVARRKWPRARRLVKQVKSPLPHKLLDWMYFAERGNGATFGQISAFIRANPDWPRQSRLRRQAKN